MKKHLYRLVSCALLIAAAVTSAHATQQAGETKHYKICAGDTIKELSTRKVVVFSDTILYDTLVYAGTPENDTLINVYDVNVYPTFLQTEYKELEIGESFEWRDRTIDRAGTYERRYQSKLNGCDSIYRLIVTEHVYTPVIKQITKNLCAGHSISFGGQTLDQTGVYTDTIHLSHYDSVTILTLNVIKKDTVIDRVRIPEGQSWTWNGKSYNKSDVYDTIVPNRFGCDSLSRLVLTVYSIDTIDTVVFICPSTSFTWHGFTRGQTGDYEFPGVRDNGDYVIYRLHLTVREMQEEERTFSICDDEKVTFNGQVYPNAGTYFNQYTCDTLFKLIITKHPSELHQQYATLTKDQPYYWQYQLDGETKTDTLNTAGLYEHVTQNPETGCKDIWQLILSKDDATYKFDTVATICENEEFEWRGKKNLNLLGIGTTTHYYVNYKTKTGYDSIYHLALTVNPVKRVTQTIPFCGEITWNGHTYTESETLVDTLTSLRYNCDSIVTTILRKGVPFHRHDTATIVPGEVLIWRGETIETNGLYKKEYKTVYGCDSIYSLGVGIRQEAPFTKIKTERVSICEGDAYPWRGDDYSISGRYSDTTRIGEEIDSILVLDLTVNPTYAWTERITFTTFPQTYHGIEIPKADIYYDTLHATTGCDSILTLIVDREIILDDSTVTICPGQTFIWRGKERRESGRYVEIEKDDSGQDSVEHVLNLTVRYIPDTRINKTICAGSSYTFGDELLTQSGVYTKVFKQDGCDSTVILSLNVVKPDTIRSVHHINPGGEFVWHNKTYRETGVDFFTTTNRFGCDSTEMLILTVNRVDTIDSTATICPSETLLWHGIRASQSGDYANAEQQPDGSFNYYRLHLTVRELAEVDSTFTLCGDEELIFNGKTYSEAGHYYDKAGCDTLYHLHIQRIPNQVYITNASLNKDGVYRWTYMDNGVKQENKPFTEPGTYEFKSPNGTTGCEDIYRLILSKDETSYHFVETLTICEGDDFSWRGRTSLSSVPGTSRYYDNLETRTGKDSIYELVLTVTPVKRSILTTTFCGEITWKGQTITNTTVLYDTLISSTGCDSIVRMNFDKATSFYSHDTATIVQGETLLWHGQSISGDGLYIDSHTNQYGCDSTYTIGVGVSEAPSQTNMYTTHYSICEGDVYTWRGNDYSPTTTTTYVDTKYKAGTEEVDSIFILKLVVHPSYKDTIVRHLYTCGKIGASIRYQGTDYYTDTEVVSNLHTVYGCDSIVKMYLHFNTALYLTDTIKIADTELPYTWHYRLGGAKPDTVLTAAGTYHHIEAAEGSCYNQEELVLLVYPTYLYEQDTTICELDKPFHWLNGPADHVNDALWHTVGTTHQYEYRYQTVNGTDSIFHLNLTIDPAPMSIERYHVCQGSPQVIHGKTYGSPMAIADTTYRDTIAVPVAGTICDSTIYVEVYVASVKTHTQTVIIKEDSSYIWNGLEYSTGGTYTKIFSNTGVAGCDSIDILHLIIEFGDERVICSNDTGKEVHPDKKYPLVWEHPQLTGAPDTLYTSGSYYDTIYDAAGYATALYRMDLTVVHPYDTTIVLRGCQDRGVVWRDSVYKTDTSFVDRVEVIPHTHAQPCDSVFHVTIKIDTVYKIVIDTTLCEYQLPLIVGRINPDTLWQEGHYEHPDDTTLCGCDSLIDVKLTIIPKLTHNDSTFICEDSIKAHPVWLGDTVTPAFIYKEGGIWADKWQGKYHGVRYTTDTIVEDTCNGYFHHIIVRPSQKMVLDTTLFLCPDDSLQLFWGKGDDTTWFYKDTLYEQHTPMPSKWTDKHHQYSYANDAYSCDSITRWHIKVLPRYHKDTTAHILLGDSIWWGGQWRFYTGTYDSVNAPAPDTSSFGDTCRYTYPLHLIADTAYYFRDTVTLCTYARQTHYHIWPETGHKQFYTVGKKDSVAHHFFDSLRTYDRRDSIYDLCVNYRLHRDTLIFDTICEDTRLRFDSIGGTYERWLTKPGTYHDTVDAVNGCDSAITLMLYVRPRIVTTPKSVSVTDRELPYLWDHTWKQNGTPKDSTDTLRASGLYTFLMPSIHGCDSIDSLYLSVHQTHVFRDTVDVCDAINKTLTHSWLTGYKQTYTTPLMDDTAYYADTLQTRIKYDSIYVLCINFHQTYLKDTLDTICEGERYRFDRHIGNITEERWVNQRGIYRDTLQSHYGCDSVIQLHLYVHDRVPVNHPTVHIPDTMAPYAWKHSYREADDTYRDSTWLISTSGEYEFRTTTQFGCDSIDSLTLVIHKTYLIQETPVTICQTETPYTWQDRNDITKTDVYTFRAQTVDGYDSIRTIQITVLPVLYDTIRAFVCEGDSMRWGLTKANTERFLKQSGVYNDTLKSHQYGCDSIVTLYFNTRPKYYKDTTVHIADTAKAYVWRHFFADGTADGKDSLIASGRYGHRFPSKFGCDSIDSLTLVIHPTYFFADTVTICQSETPYSWYNVKNGDSTLFQEGIYHTDTLYKRLQTKDGYDSTYVRVVNVLPVYRDTVRHEMCEGSDFYFNGVTYQKGGTYVDTLRSYKYGCDSIVTLLLTVHKPFYSVIRRNILEGQAVDFFGELKDSTGVYTHYARTKEGCDSTTILQLSVSPLVDTLITVCRNELPVIWHNRWNGKEERYYAGGIIRNDTIIDAMNYFYGVKIDILEPVFDTIWASICEGTSYPFKGHDLTKPDIYRDTTLAANGCDSITTLILTVNKPYYSLIHEDILEGNSVMFFGEEKDSTGIYTHYGRTKEECDSTTVLELVVHQLVDTTVTVCSNTLPYVWNNRWSGKEERYYRAGTFRNDTTINGQKRFYGLRLLVNEPVDTTIYRTICSTEVYQFGGKNVNEKGEYRDTLVSEVNGCDSIVVLHLNVIPVTFHSTDTTIFEGDSILFHDVWYKTAGTYTHKTDNGNQCFNIDELVVNVHDVVALDTFATICTNELPFVWNGIEYNATGTYARRTTWTSTSHVITTLHLTVFETPRENRMVDICEGSTFFYKNKPFTHDTIFNDTIYSANLCDSIITYVVRTHPTYDRIDTLHISEKQTHDFHGKTIHLSGTYEWTGSTNKFGCDSMEHLVLIVHPSFFQGDTIEICKSDTDNYPLKWHGLTIENSGTYSDSALSVYGFDSVYQLVVTVHQSYMIEEKYDIGVGEVLKIHGRDISKPAIYYDTLRTIHGCDSVFHVVVNQRRTRDFTWTRTICQSDPKQFPYEFFGRRLTHTGTYTYTSQYKDSIVTLNLTVNPASTSEKRIVIADTKNYYTYDGKLYENLHVGDNLFADTLNNQWGCDSIKRLIICMTTRYSEWTPVPLCPGSEVKIDGQIITEAGLYTFVRRSRVTGEMDSLYRVEVYDAPAYEFDIQRAICDGDTIFFNDSAVAITRGGHHDIVMKTVEGCDSIYHLDLTVYPSYHFYTTVTTRDFEPYTWLGKTYFETGVYDRIWPTINDCDSAYSLDLHVVPTLRDTITETICTGQSLIWRGKEYDIDGYYTDTVWHPEANFSAIYSMRLIVAYPTIITAARTGDICADAESFDIHIEYAGNRPTNYSVYFDQLAKREGFEDIINAKFGPDMIAHVNLPQYASIAYENHPYYVRPDYYTMRIALDNGVCGINKSDSLQLLIKYPSWILEQNWNDVVAPLKEKYNGGFEFSQMEWYVNGVQQPNTNLGYLYSKELLVGDEVVMMATRKGENIAIPTCPLIIQTPNVTTYDTPVIVYPTQAPKQMPQITVEAPLNGRYDIYSATGLLLESGKLDEGKTILTLPSINGIYFIRTYQGHEAESHKVILY